MEQAPDPTDGIVERRRPESWAERVLRTCPEPAGFVILALDNFKSVNETTDLARDRLLGVRSGTGCRRSCPPSRRPDAELRLRCSVGEPRLSGRDRCRSRDLPGRRRRVSGDSAAVITFSWPRTLPVSALGGVVVAHRSRRGRMPRRPISSASVEPVPAASAALECRRSCQRRSGRPAARRPQACLRAGCIRSSDCRQGCRRNVVSRAGSAARAGFQPRQ